MDAFEPVRRVMNETLETGLFSAGCVDIGNEDGTVFRYMLGRTSRLPDAQDVNEKTLFDMASCTKIMTVTMITLQLVEQGVIALEDPVRRFFLDGVSAEAQKITIGSLLRHSSGLPGHHSLIGCDRDHVAEAILAIPPAYPQDTKNEYTCMGFILLGEILQKVTGKPLDQLAEERVFSVLGMGDTTFHPAGTNIAATRNKEPYAGVVHDFNARYMGRPVGNAGVFSNIGDTATFARMMLCEGAVGDARVLQRGTMRLASQAQPPFTEEDRCLGFHLFRRGKNPAGELVSWRAFGHTGWTGTSIMADPERHMYMAVLTNSTYNYMDYYPRLWRFRRVLHNAGAAAMEVNG